MPNSDKFGATVRAICAEYDIEIIPANIYPMPGQTRAVATMCQILAKYGEGHFRLVMTTLGETRGNNALIEQSSLWAVSDLIRACPEWVEERTSEWLQWWDEIPLGPIICTISQLRGVVNQRHALAGAIYWRLCTYSQERMSTKDTASTLKNKVPEVGRARSNANREQAIEMGRKLIEIKSHLPRGEWLPWVEEQSGLSYGTVQRYMRMAKAA
ncbi:hypothetical protein NXC24_CH01960 [Rhizobium sp. NXC24]|nr:hypothetical protein NXC24_CH01960 [Rhizobium sp. NXC24]